LRLEYVASGRNLHSHREKAPITVKHFQVTGYGEVGHYQFKYNLSITNHSSKVDARTTKFWPLQASSDSSTISNTVLWLPPANNCPNGDSSNRKSLVIQTYVIKMPCGMSRNVSSFWTTKFLRKFKSSHEENMFPQLLQKLWNVSS
jgi:hypothetical protein